MTTARSQVDPAVLRVVLQRLSELDLEVQSVTDIVLDQLPYVDAGAAQPTVTDVAATVVDAFVTLADSLGETRQLTSDPSMAVDRPLEIDLRVVHDLHRAAR
jgi:formate-dependent phosphoribosylglycinamide formyltransferase (GAR transformylase)